MFDESRYLLISGIYDREYVTFKKNKTYFKYFDIIRDEYVCVSFTNGCKYNNYYSRVNEGENSPCIATVENVEWSEDMFGEFIFDPNEKMELFQNFRILRNKEMLKELKEEYAEHFI